MASMDYCVFENTTTDLNRCVRKLQDKIILNPYEEPYRHRLYELAKKYISAYESYEPLYDD